MDARSTPIRPLAPLSDAPTVTIVLLVFNRREELRRSLLEMLEGCDYDPVLIDVVVVDNASEDGSAEMVAADFPRVRLIRRRVNCGVSGWNDGFDVATGDLVLVLDDDCYLPGDGLRRAIAEMREREADMVSFSVTASRDPEYRFDLAYRTGLLAFWGCAVLLRREVLERIGGFDPKIFVWAHEVEFMLRFFDGGFCHLHLPEVSAVHMKDPSGSEGTAYFGSRAHRFNARNFGYVVAKHLRLRDALGTLVALVVTNLRHGVRIEAAGFAAVGDTISGFACGLRVRDPVKNARLSRAYRRNFYSFAPPWWVSRPVGEWLRPAVIDGPQAKGVAAYFARRPAYYPLSAATLRF